MNINGFELNYTEEQLHDMRENQSIKINLIDKDFEGYKELSEKNQKALQHLVAAAKIFNRVSQKQDNPFNHELYEGLKKAAETSSYAKEALWLFTSFNGAAGLNGIEKNPIEIFKDVHLYPGKNFYPQDLSVEEFHKIIEKMLDEGKVDELKKILSARTMVRRKEDELYAIDYTQYFSKEFSEIANELEVAAYYCDDEPFKDFLGWQAQALIQNNEDMDMLADKHWAVLQDSPLEFTIGRENYEDEITTTIFDNKPLLERLQKAGIEIVPKDSLGARVGIVNKKGTDLILKFKELLPKLAQLMPFADKYEQHIGGGNLKQTMVDVDLAALTGDYAQCRGGITTAQNLPNSDKLAVKTGGGRRNVYHRQVRQSGDKERQKKILHELVKPELHKYYDLESLHLFVIGHENGHSLGPDSSYQTALGAYHHIMEENKADVISYSMMPQYVKAGIIDEETLKKIYLTGAVSLFLTAEPVLQAPHRVADLMQFNYLLEHGAIWFDNGKLDIDFEKFAKAMRLILEDTINLQLSKNPQKAKEFVEKYAKWEDINQKIADVYKKLGLKPYKEIVTHF